MTKQDASTYAKDAPMPKALPSYKKIVPKGTGMFPHELSRQSGKLTEKNATK